MEDFTVSLIEAVPQLPVADFSASPLIAAPGEPVSFTDLSTGDPDSWEWILNGGDPAVSNLQNPVVTYNSPGTYDVQLTVSNSEGSGSVTRQGYITVKEEIIPDLYCVPVAVNSLSDWISKVEIGTALVNSSYGDGYSLWPSLTELIPGNTYPVSLSPYNARNKNFWRVWIDFNRDGDFNDSDETLVIGNNKKGELTTSISIPAYASGVTRMRVMMCTGNAPSACNDNFSGEVEDYDVSFSGSVSIFKSGRTEGSFAEGDYGYKIYPNPAGKTLFLQLDKIGEGDYFRIFNTPGQTIVSKRIKSSVTAIDVENFVPGLYYISVMNNGMVRHGKFIKTDIAH